MMILNSEYYAMINCSLHNHGEDSTKQMFCHIKSLLQKAVNIER